MTQGQHPSLVQLTAFDQGRLTPADWAKVEAHLSGCAFCCRLLEGVGDDTLVSLLREPGERPTTADAGGLTPHPAAPPEVPAPLVDHPRYRVEGLLGAGGMGWVFKAEHRLMARPVALKVIRGDLMDRPAAVERFRQEVRAAARLAHPNIVTAHDAEQAGDAHFLVMEYVEGESLENLVRRHGPLPVAEACAYARQAALGLGHAHERGMVHRDVKPANLLRTPDGTVKVLDFGLARFASEARGGPLTPEGAILGTPDYVAPEQALNPQQADIRADLYSLGCTLYFLLAGKPPFPKGTVLQKLMAHQGEAPPPLTVLRPGLPQGLPALIDRLMSKDPAHRPQTPAEVAEALAPFTAQWTPPPTEAKQGPPRRPRGRAWLWGAVGVILLGGAAGAIAWFVGGNRGGGTEPPGPGDDQEKEKPSPKAAEVRCLGGNDVPFTCAVFSADGKKALAAGADHLIRVWDLDAGRETGRLRGHLSPVTALAFSADGRRAVSGGQDGRVAVWDLEKQGWTRNWQGHNGPVRGVAFDQDQKHVVTAGEDYTLKVWNSETAAEKEGWRHVRRIDKVGLQQLSPDRYRGRFVTPGSNGYLYTWRRGEWQPARAEPLRKHEGPALCACWSWDRRYLLSGGADATLRLWSVDAGKTLLLYKGHTAAVLCVDLTHDDRWALSGGTDRTVRLWDVVHGREEARLDGHTDAVLAVAFHPDGRHALSAGRDGTLRTWRLPEGLGSGPLGFTETVHCAAVTPDCAKAFRGIGTEVIHVWDLPAKKEIGVLKGHERTVLGLALTVDGKTLASCGWDGLVKLWDVEKGKEVHTLRGHDGAVRAVAFSTDGRTLASAGADGTVRLWDVATGEVKARLTGHWGEVLSVSLAGPGKPLASAGADGTVRLWDVTRERELFCLAKHVGAVNGVALTPDGAVAISVGVDATVRLWDTATGEEKAVLPNHTGPLRAVAVALDGKYFATGGADGVINLWSLPAGKKVTTLRRPRELLPIWDLSFLPDGKHLISASVGGPMLRWDIKTDRGQSK
jgi:WD40 repeat protein